MKTRLGVVANRLLYYFMNIGNIVSTLFSLYFVNQFIKYSYTLTIRITLCCKQVDLKRFQFRHKWEVLQRQNTPPINN